MSVLFMKKIRHDKYNKHAAWHNMRLQEIITITEAGDVIDAAHRFRQAGRSHPGRTGDVIGTDKFGSFNSDTGVHGAVKRHVGFNISMLLPDFFVKHEERLRFMRYFDKEHIPRINGGIDDVPFKTVEWMKVDDVEYSEDFEIMQITFTVRPNDPSSPEWLQEIKNYLQKEAKVALGLVLRGDV